MKRSQRLRSTGDATIGGTRHPVIHDRMDACLRITTDNGIHHVIELELQDVRSMFEDLVVLLGADQPTVDAWWRRLADHRDGRPAAPRVKVAAR